jgi:putative FmdB family regulatory protein
MPNYEYRCEACGETFSRSEHISEHGSNPPTCPKCKSNRVQPLMSSFYAKTARKS